MGSLFGKKPKEVPSQQSQIAGFSALPKDIQDNYRNLLSASEGVLNNPSQYFAPMGITDDETSAQNLIRSYQNPDQYRANIETLLSPYRGIITDDINRAYEDPYSALKSRASEAGAFGSSRMRNEEADLEESRFRALASAMQGQYNVAQNQMQQNIGNLLGFGGLQRGIDLAQRGALPQAISMYGNVLSPLLRTQQSTNTGGYQTSGGMGTLGKVGQAAQAAASVAALFASSDRDIKENIVYVGNDGQYPRYRFNYIGDDIIYEGVMAQDVLNITPHAVFNIDGILAVNYDMIGQKMEVVS